MVGFIRFTCILAGLVALMAAPLAQVTPTELRAIVGAADAPLNDRTDALLALWTDHNDDPEELAELAAALLPFAKNETAFVRISTVLGGCLRMDGKNDEAMEALTAAQDLLEETQNLDGFNLRLELGRTHRDASPRRYKQALYEFQAALDIAESMGDVALQVKGHDALGYVYSKLKDQPSALNHYTFIMQYSNSEEALAQARYNIALQYDDDAGTKDTALSYMLDAREIFRRLGDRRKEGRATVSIANLLRGGRRLDEAKQEYEVALGMAIGLGPKVTCYEYLGQIAADQGRFEDARDLLLKGLELDSENNNNREVYLLTKLGKVLISLGEATRAAELCDSLAKDVIRSPRFNDYFRATRLTDCWDCLGSALFALEEYKSAFNTFERRDSAMNAYESIADKGRAELGMELYEYESLRAQERQRMLDKQRDDQRTLLVVIVLLLIAFAIFITSRYRFTRRQSQLISIQGKQLQDRQRELIRANAELEIALNHKAVFLSNMSHEIRTPLNAIVGMSNLATKEEMAEGARKYLRNIVTASSNLIDIVNDILDFSKLEAGKLEIALEPFSVNDALEVAENVMRIPAEQKGLEFKVEADASLPSHLMGDASRLNQVLINLIGNAIKFTLNGGVTMNAAMAPLPPLPEWCPAPPKSFDHWFVVRVTDTGIGIPADKLEKIFESFNQGDQLKTRKFGGTGLGLSISKQIVELQGGVIWVESVDGVGSTFAFALPALVSEGEIADAEEVTDDTEIGPLRILIAEDNPFNVIVTEDTLSSELEDLTIGKAENGRIAFEKVRDEAWDLVLMDVHMPEMSGLEATAAIRKLPDQRAETLIIAMTASVLREETDSYIRHGMDGFVPKPFQVEQLISEIRRLRKAQKKMVKEKPTIPPLRILIAEDNPFNVIVAEDTLRSEIPDVTIGKAENGKVAFESVRDGDWDLVLMDIAMPEMTGLEATAAIRKLADPEKADITIIAMTASVLKEETDHYLKKGMNGFVPKPFRVEQLLGEIQRAHLSRK